MGWSLEQVLSVSIDASGLAEQLGWHGQEGFQSLMTASAQMVRDFIFIAQTEREVKQADGR